MSIVHWLVIPLAIGALAGVIVSLPFFFKKIDKTTLIAGFLFQLFMAVVYRNFNTPMPWYLDGILLYLALSLPVGLIISKTAKNWWLWLLLSVIIGFAVSVVFTYVR